MNPSTTRNKHAVLTFKQLMGKSDSKYDMKSKDEGRKEEGSVYQRKLHLITTPNKNKIGRWLHFKVQEVAVDLVVDVRIIFLLAQVKAGDVHGRLKRERYCWLLVGS